MVKISARQHDDALMAMIRVTSASQGVESRKMMDALAAALTSLGIEIEQADSCLCDPKVKEYCASTECRGGDETPIWVNLTWAKVRRGDVVRLPGMGEEHAAEVVEIATLQWHVNDQRPAGMSDEDWVRREKNIQFRPGEYAADWAARPVTIRALSGELRRLPNVDPNGPVLIRTTAAEDEAIERLGGWGNRL